MTGAIQLEELALRCELALGRVDAALARIDRLAEGAPRPEVWGERRVEVLQQASRAGAALMACRELERRIAALPAAQRGLTSTKERAARLQALRRRLEDTRTGTESGKR